MQNFQNKLSTKKTTTAEAPWFIRNMTSTGTWKWTNDIQKFLRKNEKILHHRVKVQASELLKTQTSCES